MGGLFVTKLLGPAALAQFAIGAYAQPIVTVLRNSLSDVLLGEMAARRLRGDDDLLTLWRRSTVVTAIFLRPARHHPGALRRYHRHYVIFAGLSAGGHSVSDIRACAAARDVDFGIPLRALNRTAPILRTNLLAIVVNAALMAFMVPAWGLAGAAIALILSRIVEGTYLARELTRAFNLHVRDLARWSDLGKIVAAATAAGAVLFLPLWSGLLGVLGGAAAFGLTMCSCSGSHEFPRSSSASPARSTTRVRCSRGCRRDVISTPPGECRAGRARLRYGSSARACEPTKIRTAPRRCA